MVEETKDSAQQKLEPSPFNEIDKLTEKQEPIMTEVNLKELTMKVTRTFSVNLKDSQVLQAKALGFNKNSSVILDYKKGTQTLVSQATI
jgi:hypothetical protein